MNAEQFARSSFERDKKIGCVDGSWAEEKNLYLDEALFISRSLSLNGLVMFSVR